MLAQALRLQERPFALRDGDWVYERKLDGLRCIAVCNGRNVELWSRNRLSFDARFPEIAGAVREFGVDNLCLDGEVVAFEGERTSFAKLQQAGGGTQPTYFVFDLLHLLGRDTTGLPLSERYALLSKLMGDRRGLVRTVEQLRGDPGDLLAQACASGWEGLVAKRLTSTYRGGRSPDWRKLKCSARQELVIGGWTDPTGSRVGFGALLTGYYDDGGALRYAGKVGTGFSTEELTTLYRVLRDSQVDASPFDDTVAERRPHWVRPEMVAEVEFTEWTRDGRLRHPSYLGLRPDKRASEVRREPSSGS